MGFLGERISIVVWFGEIKLRHSSGGCVACDGQHSVGMPQTALFRCNFTDNQILVGIISKMGLIRGRGGLVELIYGRNNFKNGAFLGHYPQNSHL